MILRVELVGSHGRWKRPLPSNSPHDHMILVVRGIGLRAIIESGNWEMPFSI
jgi:hypothetical protein